MGKPKGKNGFFYYMLHKQQELKRNGEHLEINNPRLQKLAGDEWKALNTEQRIPFDSRAKAEKERARSQTIPIHTRPYHQRQENFNRTLTEQTDQMEDETDREEYLDKMIECCVKACKSKEDLINASFFVISSNIMIQTEKNEFYPLEIGICQYSIKDGIQFTYHQFVDPGKVPIGYMSMAKSWCEDCHKIPFDNFYAASDNYQKIVEDIAQILDNSRFTNEISGRPTPMLVYCNENQIEQNKGVLKWLANKYQKIVPTFQWDLEVMDLGNLLYHISNTVGRPIRPAMAEEILKTSAFDYSAETNCGFHEEMDNKNCARGEARRYCYMMSQALCQMFDVSPTPNHLPPKRENVVTQEYRVELVDVRAPPANRYQMFKANEQSDDWAPNTSAEPGREAPQSSQPPPRLMGIGRGRGWNRR